MEEETPVANSVALGASPPVKATLSPTWKKGTEKKGNGCYRNLQSWTPRLTGFGSYPPKHPPGGVFKTTNVLGPGQPSAWRSAWTQERAANTNVISPCYDDQRAQIFP